jgi:hypothetical protein
MGSQKSQCRTAQSVTNHLNFCMMATTITWIYADRLKANPERRHKVKGRTSFAFFYLPTRTIKFNHLDDR